MRPQLRVILALVLAMSIGAVQRCQAQQPKEAARDFSRLLPASSLLYAEMSHANMTREFLDLIKGSALNDFAAFRDDLYRKLKVESAGAGFDFKSSAIWAFVLTPEFLDEVGRMKGHAVALTGVKEGRLGREPSFVWAINAGTSNIVPLIVRDVLTLVPSMKTVRTVESVRLYQAHERDSKYDQAKNDMQGLIRAVEIYQVKNKQRPAALEMLLKEDPPLLKDRESLVDPWKKPYQYDPKAEKLGMAIWCDSPDGKITINSGPTNPRLEAMGPVLAAMPGLVVVGSDPDLVGDVILRAKGKKAAAAALADLAEFKQFAAVRQHQQLFGYVDLRKFIGKDGMLYANPAGFATFFGFESALFQMEGLLGPDSCKELTAAFWLDNSNPHLQLALNLSPENPGPLTQLLSSRTVDPRVLHFAPESTLVTLSVPLFKDAGDWPRLLAAVQKASSKFGRDKPKETYQVAITPDGKRAVTLRRYGDLKVWDVELGKEMLSLDVFGDVADEVRVAISPDGKLIAVAGYRRNSLEGFNLAIWDGVAGKRLRTWKSPKVSALAFSFDGKRIAAGDLEGTITQWDVDTGKALDKLNKQHMGGVNTISFSHKDNRLVSCGYDGTIKESDALSIRKTSAQCVAFSPDDKFIVSGGFDGLVQIWDPQNAKELFSLKGQRGSTRCVGFSPNGKRLITGSSDGSIKVWDIEKKQELLTLHGHVAPVMSVAMSDDRIVSGDTHGNIKIWNAQAGFEILSLPQTPSGVLVRQFGDALSTPKGKEMIVSAHTMTLAVAGNAFEELGPLVIVEMKDQAAAQNLIDMAPLLFAKSQKAQTKTFGTHTIHTLAADKNHFALPLSYGREGDIVVLGVSEKGVAEALRGGAAKRGFAAQPDVARTLAKLKDSHGLILWSGRNIVASLLKAEEAAVRRMINRAKDNDDHLTPLERDLLALYPKHSKKIVDDFTRLTQDLPAGSLNVSATPNRLTFSASQHGLETTVQRLIDALVEWDLTRPNFFR